MELTGNWDGRISRRTLLRTGGTLAAGLVLFDRAALRAEAFAASPFRLGVASGDPTANGSSCGRGSCPATSTAPARALARTACGTRSRPTRASAASSSTASSRRCRMRCTPCISRSAACGRRRLTGTASRRARTRARWGGRGRLRRPPSHPVTCALRSPRLAVLGRLLHGVRGHGTTGPGSRRAPRGLHLRGAGRRHGSPRAAAPAHVCEPERLPDPPRSDADGPRSPGRPRGVPLADDVGRPRVRQQLRRPRHRRAGHPARDGRRAARGRLPRVLGARAAVTLAQARGTEHAAVPARAVGARGHVPRARHAAVPLEPDAHAVRGRRA